MNVRLEGTEPEVPSQKLASLNVFALAGTKIEAQKERAALLGSKTGTDRQTNKQTDKEQGCLL